MSEELTDEEKQELLASLDEYVNAKIDLRTLCIRPSLNQEQVEKRVQKASKVFFLKIMALKLKKR